MHRMVIAILGAIAGASMFAATPASAADKFGSAVAGCDFNGDGFADLAVGVPDENFGAAAAHAGAVNVLYGSPSGVTSTGDTFWNQDSLDVLGFAEIDDHFGAALAGGDFNHDGFCDLAIGIPGEDVASVVDAGAVQILYGSPTGLSSAGNQVWDQDSAEGTIAAVDGVAEEGDAFGSALATGDFDGDGFDDLAIGVPGENVTNRPGAGAVNVLYGSAHGLTAGAFGRKDQFWHQNQSNVTDYCEPGDHFGAALAAGDFNADGFADLAVGVPDEDIGGATDAGLVNVIYGSPTKGLYGSQLWSQNASGIEGTANKFDRFGAALAAGDFNGDGFTDLAIGVPGEDVGGAVDAGAVNVIYGSRNKLSYNGDQIWDQNKTSILGVAEAGDHFGSSLAVADFNGDGFADLAIGVPNKAVDGNAAAGAVQVLYGTALRLSASGNQLWTQNSTDVTDAAGPGDGFGLSLAGADFDGDGFADLAIGVPREDVGTVVDAGAVNVLYGTRADLSAARNQFWNQNVGGVEDQAE